MGVTGSTGLGGASLNLGMEREREKGLNSRSDLPTPGLSYWVSTHDWFDCYRPLYRGSRSGFRMGWECPAYFRGGLRGTYGFGLPLFVTV